MCVLMCALYWYNLVAMDVDVCLPVPIDCVIAVVVI